MPTIVVLRSDVTTQEVADVLRHQLDSQHHVLADTALNWNPFGNPRPGHPDTLVVGKGSNRLFRAQVKISREPSGTRLEVHPGGIGPVPRLANRFGIGKSVTEALSTLGGTQSAN
jgi:hypothetical protein